MKQLLIALSLLALAISPSTARGQGSHAGHEYSPLVESTVNYKNWTLPNLMTDKQEDLRKLMEGKKLVMVVYFAQWCGNWRNEAPVAAKLYDKYKAQGFQIIGVSEYAFKDEVLGYFGKDGPPYPVVIESQLKDDKQDTAHYAYRQLTGDKRNWGSPWNIFLEPGKVNKTGEVLTEKAWVVNGELIEEEVDKFIASKVGAATAAMIEPCKN
jgi:thiol-disulfide isomerase/thioredoxin